MKRLFSLLLACMLLFGCGAARAVFHTAIITAATAGSELNERSHQAYSEHAAQVRSGLVANHGSIEEYDTLIKPANAELDQRTAAIGALSAALYAAAALKEALGQKDLSPALIAQSAQRILTAASAAVESLSQGLILPPVPIPAVVRQAIAGLEVLAGVLAPPPTTP
jgi:hypothetical protein